MQAEFTPIVDAFFLDTATGKRFCLCHTAGKDASYRGSILLVPPFGEEMNKARRMMAIQARSLAQHGYAVLLMDLFACGDSEGEFRNASWKQWKEDLRSACTWLRQHYNVPLSLLGLRLGALLALDFISEESDPIHRLVLWQPVLNGQQFLTQFFRLQLANNMLTGNIEKNGGTQAIRELLNEGKIVEIAGYEISSQLSTPIDTLNGSNFLSKNTPIHWIEIQNELDTNLSPARQKTVDFWQQHQINVRLTQLVAPEFWATQEISVSNELVTLTTNIFLDEIKDGL